MTIGYSRVFSDNFPILYPFYSHRPSFIIRWVRQFTYHILTKKERMEIDDNLWPFNLNNSWKMQVQLIYAKYLRHALSLYRNDNRTAEGCIKCYFMCMCLRVRKRWENTSVASKGKNSEGIYAKNTFQKDWRNPQNIIYKILSKRKI